MTKKIYFPFLRDEMSLASDEGFRQCDELHIRLDGYRKIHTAFEFLEIDNYSLIKNNK